MLGRAISFGIVQWLCEIILIVRGSHQAGYDFGEPRSFLLVKDIRQGRPNLSPSCITGKSWKSDWPRTPRTQA